MAALLFGIAIGRSDFINNRALQAQPQHMNISDADNARLAPDPANQPDSQQPSPLTPLIPPGDVSAPADTQLETPIATDGYYLKEMGGNLLVYKNGDPEQAPYMNIEIDFDNLPDEDRMLLQTGIYASSPAQLQEILEDYT